MGENLQGQVELGLQEPHPFSAASLGQQPTPLAQLPVLLVENQATDGVCTPPGRSIVDLPYWFSALLAQRQVHPPLGLAGACAANGLSK